MRLACRFVRPPAIPRCRRPRPPAMFSPAASCASRQPAAEQRYVVHSAGAAMRGCAVSLLAFVSSVVRCVCLVVVCISLCAWMCSSATHPLLPAVPSQAPLASAAQSPAATPPPATSASALVHSASPGSACAPPPLSRTESSSRLLHYAPHPPAVPDTVQLCDQVVALRNELRATTLTVDQVFREVIALRQHVQATLCAQRQLSDGSKTQQVQVETTMQSTLRRTNPISFNRKGEGRSGASSKQHSSTACSWRSRGST
jgi:hypothetical protein